MALTEVVFEIGDPDHPVSRITRESARAVVRFGENGKDGTVATLAVTCGGERAASLARDLQALGHYDDVVLRSLSPQAAVYRLLRRRGRQDPPGLVPFERVLELLGANAIMEPVYVERGRWRVRAILPEPADPKRVLAMLGELQDAMRWHDFRALRVAEFRAAAYADSIRRLLLPDEEDLLRLACDLGFYESPKGCTLQDIAARVGLSVSPVHKRLKAVEQRLVQACLDPAAARRTAARRARTTRAASGSATPAMTEVQVRAVWPALALTTFSARHREADVILQPLGEESGGSSTTLVIAVCEQRDHRDAIDALRARRGIEHVDVMSREQDHLSLKVRWRATGAEDPFPSARGLRSLGRDVVLRPFVLEGGEVQVRAVLPGAATEEDVQARVAAVAEEAGWTRFEVVDRRPLASDPALAGPTSDRLTARQTEILKIAHALGYYRTPRACTLDDVARALGISANAIHKNLTAAEQKIVASYLAGSLPSAQG